LGNCLSRQLLEYYISSPNFWARFFPLKNVPINYEKMLLATLWGISPKTDLVTLENTFPADYEEEAAV
jgi:hypothetical protein